MNKVKYLSECLKSFTFDDMYMLAETPKEELQEALQELINENILKKTQQGYIYCELEQIPLPTEPVVRNETTKFVRDDDYIKFQEILIPEIKNLTTQELKQIPDFNRKKYDKYVRLLKATKGLYGKALMSFIAEYNRLNPNDKQVILL